MPLYEYKCKDCGKVTEFRSSMDNKAEMAGSLICEDCGSRSFSQVFGGIALTQGSSGGNDLPPDTGGGCCPGGMCNL
ncbi:FmdB family zinc ribbon protein [Natronogracilivirga saccharolytica]|uniref:Zinc ribbon domain-containing protein n=1 Tax=Natronogracilivirga saccharolytica TaxID=2812953 RepID=A0A8J7RTH0_9BACT|nr:zinc ribbon domain-containing protein [Natronogracilivirga saccharolytica]MBP3192672.1 zinc ribbon domain-containing protein [Natronogracilivirga saccharolytica]